MGIVVAVCNRMEGESSNGQPWTKQTLVLKPTAGSDTEKRRYAFEFFGAERVDMLQEVKEGMLVEVSFDIQTNEYEGKYFTTLKGYNLRVFEAAPTPQPAAPAA